MQQGTLKNAASAGWFMVVWLALIKPGSLPQMPAAD
jgi:hypothetical protein